MIILYLFLGHFIGDFIFQPFCLVVWKNRSWVGVLLHSFIHFIVTGLLLYLLTFQWLSWVLSLILAIAHFFTDIFKTSQKDNPNHFFIFWLDQFLHFLAVLGIFGLSLILIQPFMVPTSIFFSPIIPLYLDLAIFLTFTVEYSFKEINAKKRPQLNFKNMSTRLFLLTLAFVGLMFSLPAASLSI